MKDLLKNLRQHLSAMIDEIDNYTHANSDDIIIQKKDFKFIKHITHSKMSSDHLFEYKDGINFRLFESDPYELKVFEGLTNGRLDNIILNKTNGYDYLGHFINYNLESKINTTLRNLYTPSEEEKNDN